MTSVYSLQNQQSIWEGVLVGSPAGLFANTLDWLSSFAESRTAPRLGEKSKPHLSGDSLPALTETINYAPVVLR